MSGWDWLTVAGAAVEVVGFLVTLQGLASTWRQFATDGERFTEPIWRAAARGWRPVARVWSSVRTLLAGRQPRPDRPQPQTIWAGSAEDGSRAGAPTVTQYPPTLEGRIDSLQAQVRTLTESLAHTQSRLVIEERRRAADVTRLDEQAAADRMRVDTLSRQVALDGLRKAAAGLGIALVGLLMQAAASVLGSS